MIFQTTSEFSGGVATINLVGQLDADSAPAFMEEIVKIMALSPSRLVLLAKGLTFMSSAGLRVLIYARQRLGRALPIYVVEPQESLRETLTLTGFERAVYIVDEAPNS
ncbi:STAS domain-containing protein [Sorangium sp. So ce291]|uniref:STAS domain-containing protein n=1 Tax=Sorangium sp. So ce291 TaxID=3133294 RepID=UPI003F5DB62F